MQRVRAHLVSVSVEEVDAVPGVGGLALAHPPAAGEKWQTTDVTSFHRVGEGCSPRGRNMRQMITENGFVTDS